MSNAKYRKMPAEPSADEVIENAGIPAHTWRDPRVELPDDEVLGVLNMCTRFLAAVVERADDLVRNVPTNELFDDQRENKTGKVVMRFISYALAVERLLMQVLKVTKPHLFGTDSPTAKKLKEMMKKATDFASKPLPATPTG